MKLTYFKEGDIICNECHGEGGQRDIKIFRRCNKCYGSGKLDWIEQLAGKKDPYDLLIKKLEKRNLSR